MSLVKKKKLLSIICMCAHIILKRKEKAKKNKKRKIWVRDWLTKRHTDGAHAKVIREFCEVNNQNFLFKNYLRMDENTFKKLLHLVAPYIDKMDTNMCKAISANERLAVTMRFLASGDSYKSLSVAFRIAPSTISIFIPEVCNAIYKALIGKYLKTPSNEQEWIDVASKFNEKWNFPNCLGAVDGKHIVMNAPGHSGSTFYNYKGSHSIVLMGIADADYKFLYIDVGCNGRVSDGGVFGKCTFQQALDNASLQLPASRPLPSRELDVPFVLVADDAFRMQKHLLKPYPGKNLSASQRIFNYRLSRARRVIENVFGIMVRRFQIFSRPLQLNAENTTTITLACYVLHNFLTTENANYVQNYTADNFDENGDILPTNCNQRNIDTQGREERPSTYITNEAKEIRTEFEQYFMSTNGELPFQYRVLC